MYQEYKCAISKEKLIIYNVNKNQSAALRVCQVHVLVTGTSANRLCWNFISAYRYEISRHDHKNEKWYLVYVL